MHILELEDDIVVLDAYTDLSLKVEQTRTRTSVTINLSVEQARALRDFLSQRIEFEEEANEDTGSKDPDST